MHERRSLDILCWFLSSFIFGAAFEQPLSSVALNIFASIKSDTKMYWHGSGWSDSTWAEAVAENPPELFFLVGKVKQIISNPLTLHYLTSQQLGRRVSLVSRCLSSVWLLSKSNLKACATKRVEKAIAWQWQNKFCIKARLTQSKNCLLIVGISNIIMHGWRSLDILCWFLSKSLSRIDAQAWENSLF